MSLSLITRYSLSALLFAAAVSALWLLGRRAAGRRGFARRDALELALVAYLAALIQITALRFGLVTPRWLQGGLRPIPLKTLLVTAEEGPWMFVYHTLGNLMWFAPLGFMLPALSPRWDAWRCLGLGAALSAGIEAAQFLMGTGICDVDDVLLNALGALAGRGVWRVWSQLRHRKAGGGGSLQRRDSML